MRLTFYTSHHSELISFRFVYPAIVTINNLMNLTRIGLFPFEWHDKNLTKQMLQKSFSCTERVLSFNLIVIIDNIMLTFGRFPLTRVKQMKFKMKTAFISFAFPALSST